VHRACRCSSGLFAHIARVLSQELRTAAALCISKIDLCASASLRQHSSALSTGNLSHFKASKALDEARGSAVGVIDAFRPLGFDVVAYDARAHGDSGVPSARPIFPFGRSVRPSRVPSMMDGLWSTT
jgi:hypothetical protein